MPIRISETRSPMYLTLQSKCVYIYQYLSELVDDINESFDRKEKVYPKDSPRLRSGFFSDFLDRIDNYKYMTCEKQKVKYHQETSYI